MNIVNDFSSAPCCDGPQVIVNAVEADDCRFPELHRLRTLVGCFLPQVPPFAGGVSPSCQAAIGRQRLFTQSAGSVQPQFQAVLHRQFSIGPVFRSLSNAGGDQHESERRPAA